VLYLDDFVLRALNNNTRSLKKCAWSYLTNVELPSVRVMGAVFWNVMLNDLVELLGSNMKK
jgi:hypothetical protein